MPEHRNLRSAALQNGRKLFGLIAWDDWVSKACSDEHRELAEISDQIWRERNLRSKEHGGLQIMRVKEYEAGCDVRPFGVSDSSAEMTWASLVSNTDVIPWCAAHGTGVIVYSPMQSGLLTDTFNAERVSRMAEDDWRRRDPEFQEPQLSRNLALRDALKAIAQRHRTTVSAVAVAWTLTWPGVTGAIVGARSAQQVDGWIQAGVIQLTTVDVEEIGRAIRETRAGSGPVMPPAPQVAGGVRSRVV
jgi:aryl-alcohol dehydrogenase-like predicted oxidoreductase